MNRDLILETHNLCKAYRDQVILQDVNMHIEKGRVYGLLGRNGVGKTSIMKMILGLTSISSGTITVFGKPLKDNGMQNYARMGSLIEAPGFYPSLSGYDNLKIFSILRGTTRKNAIKEVMDLVNLPYHDQKPFSSYSLGMKQRLGLANALINEPEFLILDEPTNGLDPIGIAELRTLIRDMSDKQGKTILISSHQLAEMEQLADTIGVLHDTRLVKECNRQELEEQNQRYIKIQVSNLNHACILMEQKLQIQDYKVIEPNILLIYDLTHKPDLVNRVLVENGVDVSMIQIFVENLEAHFKMLTGGIGIASFNQSGML